MSTDERGGPTIGQQIFSKGDRVGGKEWDGERWVPMTTTPPPARTPREIAADLILKAAAYLNGRRPVEYWEDAVASEIALLAAASSQQEELDRVRGELAQAEDRLAEQIRTANEALAICALWKSRADSAESSLTQASHMLDRVRGELARAEATIAALERANNLYREGMDERNEFKNQARAAESSLARARADEIELRKALEEIAAIKHVGVKSSYEMTRIARTALSSRPVEAGTTDEPQRAAQVYVDPGTGIHTIPAAPPSPRPPATGEVTR